MKTLVQKLSMGSLVLLLAMPALTQAADLERDKKLIREATHYARQGRVRLSYYKIRTVKIDVSSLPSSSAKTKLLNALNFSLEKIQDRYLSVQEKADVVIDCARVALDALEELSESHTRLLPIRQLPQAMEHVVDLVQDYQNQRALKKAKLIQKSLKAQRSHPSLKKALDAVEFLMTKLSDPYLSQREKIEVAEDCTKVFIQAIRDFLGQNGGGNRIVSLGTTSDFPKYRAQTKEVYVGSRGSFSSLKVKAIDDDLFIKQLVIQFTNGAVQRVYEIHLDENQHTVIPLRRGSQIQRVKITAVSSRLGGTKAAAKLFGIK